jgi:hypothetical protein
MQLFADARRPDGATSGADGAAFACIRSKSVKLAPRNAPKPNFKQLRRFQPSQLR